MTQQTIQRKPGDCSAAGIDRFHLRASSSASLVGAPRQPRATRQSRIGVSFSLSVLLCMTLVAAVPHGLAAPAPPAGPAPAAARTPSPSDPQASYVALFGEEERKVMATPSTKDDATFAAKLLSHAIELKDDPGLQRFIYGRAVVLAMKDPDGIETAVDATKAIIATESGAEKLNWKSKLGDLYATLYKRASGPKRSEAGSFLVGILEEEAQSLASQGKYADAVRRLKDALGIATTIRSPRANDLGTAVKDLQAKQQVAERLDKLRQRMSTQGGDLSVLEQLIFGYLFELDDGPMALKLAGTHPQKGWENWIAMAIKDPTTLSQSDLQGLGDWCQAAAATQGIGAAKAGLLGRAYACYSRFMKVHEKQDAERLKATSALGQVCKTAFDAGFGVLADQVVVWNTHNGGARDFGTKEMTLVLLRRNSPVWTKRNIAVAWSATADASTAIDLPPIPFDAVRLEVTAWHGTGGGLQEVQVMQVRTNLALGARTDASASINAAVHPPRLLTDGVTNSNEYQTAWLLPRGVAGWALVEPKPQPGK